MYDVVIYQNKYIPDGLQYEDSEKYDRFGYITSDDGDSLAHAKQASEGSFIVLENGSFVHVHHVRARVPYSANSSAIIIAFSADQLSKLKFSKVFSKTPFEFKAEVKFELKHSYFSRLHSAIQYLPGHVINRLTPKSREFYSCSMISE